MNDIIYNVALENSARVGKLLGVVGAFVKYDNPDLSNFYFRQLARTYIECSTDEQDVTMVREQATKRGVDLT